MSNQLELELVAVGISIAAGCTPCTRYHLAEAFKAGAARAQILACLRAGVAVSQQALAALQREFDAEFAATTASVAADDDSRVMAMTAIGAAIASNSVTQLERAIAAARRLQVNDTEIMAVVGLADRIKQKAASHLQAIIETLDADRANAVAAARLCS